MSLTNSDKPAVAGEGALTPTAPMLTPRTLFQIIWRVLAFFIAFGMITALFIIPMTLAPSDWTDEWPIQMQLYADVAGALAMFAATWIMLRFVDRRPFRSIGFGGVSVWRDLGAGLGLGAGWLALSVGVAWIAGWVTVRAPAGFSLPLLLLASIGVLFNVLTQQLLLCGYILQTIRSRSNFLVALVVSAVLFSTYHFGAFEGAWLPAVNVFVAGTLFCLAYGVTGNLWLPAAIHFTWNLLLGPALGLTVSGTGDMGLGWTVFAIEGPAAFTGGQFGLEGGLVVTFTTAILIVAIIVRARQKFWNDALDPLRSVR